MMHKLSSRFSLVLYLCISFILTLGTACEQKGPTETVLLKRERFVVKLKAKLDVPGLSWKGVIEIAQRDIDPVFFEVADGFDNKRDVHDYVKGVVQSNDTIVVQTQGTRGPAVISFPLER